MDVVIIADFCGDFGEKSNSRFLYLANLLSKENKDFAKSDEIRKVLIEKGVM